MSIHLTNDLDDNFNDLLTNIPVGIFVLKENQDEVNKYKILYSNQLGRTLLSIPKDNNINSFIKNLDDFHEYLPYGKNIETSLYEHIFSTKESNNKIFCNNEIILYIKVKRVKTKIYILIDNYEDERKNIQTQFIQNIGNQYLLTLYHEINNPINSLLCTLNEISDINCITLKRIELLLFLIRLFLKNFILYFQIFSFIQIQKDENSTINLQNLFERISEKFSKLFVYKKINQIKNFELLNDKCANYDYFFFKNLIKMSYVYFYKKSEIESQFLINVENSEKINTLKITFLTKKLEEENQEDNSNLYKSDISQYSSNIQTLKMIQELIIKLINILNIESEYDFESDENNKIIIYIKLNDDVTFGNENDLEEFNENQIDSMRKISRSITSKTGTNTIKNENDNNYISESSFKSFDSKEDLQKVFLNLKSLSFKRNCKRNHTSSYDFYKNNKSLKNKINISPFQISNCENKFQDLKKNFDKEEIKKIHHSKCKSFNTFNKKNSLFNLKNNMKDKESEITIILEENESHSPNSLKNKTNNDNNVKKIKSDQLKISNEIINENKNNYFKENKLENNKNIISECSCNDIMIVDDEHFNLSCLSNNLKKINILCDSCNDGEECLNLILKKIEKKCSCNKSNYKLILLDVVMPKMNGIDAMKHIQKLVDEKKIKNLNIIFISASVEQKIMIDIQKKYPIVKDFLPKPVKISKIKDIIKRYYYES